MRVQDPKSAAELSDPFKFRGFLKCVYFPNEIFVQILCTTFFPNVITLIDVSFITRENMTSQYNSLPQTSRRGHSGSVSNVLGTSHLELVRKNFSDIPETPYTELPSRYLARKSRRTRDIAYRIWEIWDVFGTSMRCRAFSGDIC